MEDKEQFQKDLVKEIKKELEKDKVPDLSFLFDDNYIANLNAAVYLRERETSKILGLHLVWADGTELIITNPKGVGIQVINKNGSIQRYP